MSLGERIKQIRVRKNMTQDALAEAAGITKASVSNYERNQRQPQYPAVQAIANALGVSVSELFEDVGGKEGAKNPVKERRVDNIRERRMKRIGAAFDRLSDEGQMELIKRAEELAFVPAYRLSLSEVLQRYINDKHGAEYVISENNEEKQMYSSEDGDYQIDVRHIVLKRESEACISRWHFMYYQLKGMIDDSVVKDIAGRYENHEDLQDRYSFVLDNEDAFEQFYNCFCDIRAYDDVDDFSPGNDNKPEIIFILINQETWEIMTVNSLAE